MPCGYSSSYQLLSISNNWRQCGVGEVGGGGGVGVGGGVGEVGGGVVGVVGGVVGVEVGALRSHETRARNAFANYWGIMMTAKQKWIEENLKPGEHYAGIILGQPGEQDYHLVVLADEPVSCINWQTAMDWAKSIGGELPSRREQRVLFANAKEAFSDTWYWSGEQGAVYADYAWYQGFLDGLQSYTRKSYEGRARAVRRIYL